MERVGSHSLLVWRLEALGSHRAPAPSQSGLSRTQCGGLEAEKEGAGGLIPVALEGRQEKLGSERRERGKQKERGVNHSCQVRITGELSSWADGVGEGWTKNYSYQDLVSYTGPGFPRWAANHKLLPNPSFLLHG